MFMAQKLDIEASLVAYLGTTARARRFRNHQQRLGAVLSGVWSYLFLRRAALLAPSMCPLDVFVAHRLVPALAKILRPMGFQYCSARLELFPDHQQRFQETFESNETWACGSKEEAILYCFTNEEVIIHVFGATHGILHAIFAQESTILHNLISATDAWSVFPSSTFDSQEPTPIITHKTFSFITGGCQGSFGVNVSHFSGAPGKEFLLGPHQLGDGSMWKWRLSLPIAIENGNITSFLPLHGWSVVYGAARFQIIYRLSDCNFLADEYCMPRFINIIVKSYEHIAFDCDDDWLVDLVIACHQRNKTVLSQLSSIFNLYPLCLRETRTMW
ncbi:hypothetical protein GYMLUDRAFT_252604 [Collybiopsis luxurians FD-317 M1]|uniref:Uncharacterized protein n=1 Tax=Collybiopsis luxurians FD-317 M1 TaxID=944289 RepID=A0A0D0BZR6_9AGAR|nr:hypothetical protein GYMLUDRAFT_252604 [Collybiopsis luxurians FD-317 M1]